MPCWCQAWTIWQVRGSEQIQLGFPLHYGHTNAEFSVWNLVPERILRHLQWGCRQISTPYVLPWMWSELHKGRGKFKTLNFAEVNLTLFLSHFKIHFRANEVKSTYDIIMPVTPPKLLNRFNSNSALQKHALNSVEPFWFCLVRAKGDFIYGVELTIGMCIFFASRIWNFMYDISVTGLLLILSILIILKAILLEHLIKILRIGLQFKFFDKF